jgi:hypothetical protein
MVVKVMTNSSAIQEIEQTREGQVRSGCGRQQNRAAAKFKRAVGAPKWQLNTNFTPSPARLQLIALLFS